MADRLSDYYTLELNAVRRLAEAFMETHPETQHLVGRPGTGEDPHVERLIETFAYLTARVRQKLDDEFPELTESLLNVLYPHYLRPIPSMGIVEVTLPEAASAGVRLPRGSMLDTVAEGGGSCRFRSCYDVDRPPVKVARASQAGRSADVPRHPRLSFESVLSVRLEAASEDVSLGDVTTKRLRCYLHGSRDVTLPIHRLLHGHLQGVSITGADDQYDRGTTRFLSRNAVQPVGFSPEEAVLPRADLSFDGYLILTEFFALSEKFLFFDLDISALPKLGAERAVEIVFYFDVPQPQLPEPVSADLIRLGCTPIINLFKPSTVEPIALDQRFLEHRVVPTRQRHEVVEVYSIDRVQLVEKAPGGAPKLSNVPAYFGLTHGGETGGRFWTEARRELRGANQPVDVFVSLVDPGQRPTRPSGGSLTVDLTCSNGPLPNALPTQPIFSASGIEGETGGIVALKKPTRQVRGKWRGLDRWRLISHLGLNHLSLLGGDQTLDAGGTEGAVALREILELYAIQDDDRAHHRVIQAIQDVSHKRGMARAPEHPGQFLSGIDVQVTATRARLGTPVSAEAEIFLLSQILDRMLGLYCAINAFSRLTVRLKDTGQVLAKWPARAGTQALL